MPIQVGDRVVVYGGYWDASWLGGREEATGQVLAFIPGRFEKPDAVVELDEPVSGTSTDGVEAKGKFLVLTLRYTEGDWRDGDSVHVEVCDFRPEALSYEKRRRGVWADAGAHVRFPRIE